MSSDRKIVKPKPLSGFPEWLPEQRLVELRWIDTIRRTFEAYGFCNIDPPSVEDVDVLVSKGEDADKEIYGVRRLGGGEMRDEPKIALHYDLTVPLARYVAQHFNELSFPFKRYQIQRAWRGERPQEGRFREFYQCDLDVLDTGEVSLHFDAELPVIVYEILRQLHVEPVTMHINNRKVLQGFYTGLGIADVVGAIRILDKLDKVGAEEVNRLLVDDLHIASAVAAQCVALASIRTPDGSFEERIREFGVHSELLDTGIAELKFVMQAAEAIPAGVVFADLSVARGFDYYTGTVYEGKLSAFPGYPSVFSGGRYDNLVGGFLRQNLPGVGMSIGLTRIFSKLLAEGQIAVGASCPTQILVIQLPETPREQAMQTGRALRDRGFNVEVYHESKKIGHQIRYATRKGIRYAWFPDPAKHEVKDLASGEQSPADPATWAPGK
ncbi:MAG TPA: histidine--tRNA ligase [Bryobacteraceae bacterium]|nr:histidine--tRNA ligase [Bryobacteraceae bacterium]